MTVFTHSKLVKGAKIFMVPTVSEKSSITQIRLRLHIPHYYQHQPVISQLISKYGLVINITGAMLGKSTDGNGYFDVELRGNVSQISLGMNYLESLNLRIIGKPNTDGDSWYC